MAQDIDNGNGGQPPAGGDGGGGELPRRIPELPERDKERAIVALNRLADNFGGALSPRDVVDAAKNDASPLHPYFEWNDSEAADQWRLEQARRLLRVRIVYQPLPQNTRVVVPLFSSALPNRGRGQRSYLKTVPMMTDADYADRLALDALKRAQSQLKSLP